MKVLQLLYTQFDTSDWATSVEALKMPLISRIHEVKANLWHSMQVNIISLV